MLTTFITKMHTLHLASLFICISQKIMKKYNIFVKYCHLEIRFGLVWLNIIQHIPLFCISLDIVKNAVNDLKNYFLKLLSGL